MKKHLIAAAVAAAVAVPAMAQSNVSIYGVLDAGYGEIQRKEAGSKVDEKKAFGFNSHSSSRLGIRGTEDLGGGMKASFVIETGLSNNMRSGLGANPQNINKNLTGNGTTLDATTLGDRGLFANLDFGQGTQVRVGFGSTPIRDFILAYDAAEGSNNVGNTLVNDTAFGSNRQTGLQLSHTVSGFTFTGAIYKNDNFDTASTDEAQKTNSGELLALQYAKGPLSVGFAHQKLDSKNDAEVATDPVSSTGVSGVVGKAISAFDGDRTYNVLGGSYDLGMAKLFASYGTAKVRNAVAAGVGDGKYSSASVGIQVPFGAVTAFAQLSNGENKLEVVKDEPENRDTSGYTLGVKYALSKRTYAYAVTGQTKLDAAAATSTGTGAKETKLNQTSLGLVHSF